ncbi:GNAT family N-acetyltransferase [Larkinella insperata]|uniref:GNAT family N-acetyltransferase n=1 Tax=Larkinella insperata TaxID=332158 RepID=A0ABW3Q952_9BACT|nr:GNAT family N-acetyltransferase [Larkinella insperata]
MDYLITRAKPDQLPNHLLLLGDENQQLIDMYRPRSLAYQLTLADQIVGICLLQVNGPAGEIMNIAVEPAHQGQGLGKSLLQHVIEDARQQGLVRLVIKTGNSGIGQIALYQRQGFELTDVHYNYFLQHYPDPIWENGIQCKHQLIFELSL